MAGGLFLAELRGLHVGNHVYQRRIWVHLVTSAVRSLVFKIGH